MKSVLLSIQPKWCELITSGKKTIEIRKTRPKIETPFKCYIYCTEEELLTKSHINGNIYVAAHKEYQQLLERNGNLTLSGKVIGEFICEHITNIEVLSGGLFTGGYRNGNCTLVVEHSALTAKDIKEYANDKKEVFGWHISNLVIYDEPKELSEFYKPCTDHYHYCQGCDHGLVQYPPDVETYEDLSGCCFDTICLNRITRPPQSWCYVEELEG